MIKPHDLYTQTRLAAGDMGKRTFSDFEIKTAAESAINMFEEACILNFSDVLIRSAIISLVDGAGKLPEGFLSIGQVGERFLCSPALESFAPDRGEYSVRGGNIYCGTDEKEIRITYHASPEKNETGIDLPQNILFPLARLAANILKEEFEAATAKSTEIALSTKRRAASGLPDPDMWGA